MTRFEMEVKGLLGDAFKTSAEKEAEKACAQAKKYAVVEENGAIRWKESGHYLMDDLCEKLEYAGYPFSREATKIQRDKQNAEAVSRYNHHILTEEELMEARNTFGEGTVIVDTMTGDKYIL